ncbi:MAG: nucleotidyl transferase AbiEii/AbiGii toxin family protein [Syntrophothermus sp.]
MPNELWRQLFIKAVQMLEAAGIPRNEWTFGGGTALALFLQHRESMDIDIFLHDAQLLSLLTPRVNKNLSKVTDYTESSNFLKLKYPEGEIDFILAPFLTSNPWTLMDLEGKAVQVETPEEIVIKKLFYRAETLRVRDVIDTAAVYAARKEQFLGEAAVLTSRLEALKRRWERLKPVFPVEVQALHLNEDLVKTAPALFESFLENCSSR